MQLNDFLASENGPPWLPASAADARKLMYVGQLVALIFAIIALIAGLLRILTGDPFFGTYSLVAAAIGLIVVYMMKEKVMNHLDQGRFKEASDALLIWSIVGLFVYVIPGVILLLGYLKLQDVFRQPQYQQYQAQQYQAAPAEQPAPAQPAPQPAPVQPAPAPPAPAAEHKEKKVEMTKCRKCGVNFPTFMHNCPNCNEPKH